ncbi:MAG: LLM class flavin-dependent oxidoreductase [Chloroflexia bacterium]
MAQIDFGVTIRPTPHGGTIEEMDRTNAHFMVAAQEHDLSCWVIDHFQFDTQPIHECLAFIAFNAGRFPGLRWGTLVLGQLYRNPALTAKMAATLQVLTGGRFILGLGAGDAEAEHIAYGYPFPPGRARVAQLDEAARIITALWQGGPATFTGEHYRIENAYCIPVPKPPPTLMIGGGGERRTLRVVAEHADWWNCDYYARRICPQAWHLARPLPRPRPRPERDHPQLLHGHQPLARPRKLTRRRFMAIAARCTSSRDPGRSRRPTHRLR